MESIARSEAETKDVGKRIASQLKGGDIVALHGDLGAGKTTLMKGIAAGLGVKNDITSPTFTLMNVYGLQTSDFRLRQLVHIDTYRLESEQELTAIGAEDFLGAPDTICVIEWPEKLPNLLKGKKIVSIRLTHTNETNREIVIL